MSHPAPAAGPAASSTRAEDLARGPGGAGAPRVAVALDVMSLGASTAFYSRLLGFEPVASHREGMIFESRALRSPKISGFELRLRAAFGRKPKGSSGGMLTLTLAVGDLAGFIGSTRDWVRWLDQPPAITGPAEPGTAVSLFDPDGYLIEVVQG